MAVLDPQHDGLIGLRRGQPGIQVRGPGIRIVRAGKPRGVVAVGVERIFDDVMSRHAQHVDEQRAGVFTELEAPAHRLAVHHQTGTRCRNRILPLGQHPARLVEQAKPHRRRLGRAPARPVVGRHDARVPTLGVAQQREVGGEVERIEIAPAIREHLVRDPDLVQADDVRARRNQMAHLRNQALRIKRDNEQGGSLRALQTGHRLGLVSQHGPAQVLQPLNEHAPHIQRGQIMELEKTFRHAEGIVDGHRPASQFGHQGGRFVDRQGMTQCLEKTAPTLGVAECFDFDRHEDFRLDSLRGAPWRQRESANERTWTPES